MKREGEVVLEFEGVSVPMVLRTDFGDEELLEMAESIDQIGPFMWALFLLENDDASLAGNDGRN